VRAPHLSHVRLPLAPQKVQWQKETLRRFNVKAYNLSINSTQGWRSYRLYRREWLRRSHPDVAAAEADLWAAEDRAVISAPHGRPHEHQHAQATWVQDQADRVEAFAAAAAFAADERDRERQKRLLRAAQLKAEFKARHGATGNDA
jgi:hypothetical protein